MTKAERDAMGRSLARRIMDRQEVKEQLDELDETRRQMDREIVGMMVEMGEDAWEDAKFKATITPGRVTEKFIVARALALGWGPDDIRSCFDKKEGEPYLVVRSKDKKGGE